MSLSPSPPRLRVLATGGTIAGAQTPSTELRAGGGTTRFVALADIADIESKENGCLAVFSGCGWRSIPSGQGREHG